MVLEKTRKMWSAAQGDLRFLVGPPGTNHIDQIAADEDRGRNPGEDIAVHIALHGGVRRPKVEFAGGDFHVFPLSLPLPRPRAARHTLALSLGTQRPVTTGAERSKEVAAPPSY